MNPDQIEALLKPVEHKEQPSWLDQCAFAFLSSLGQYPIDYAAMARVAYDLAEAMQAESRVRHSKNGGGK